MQPLWRQPRQKERSPEPARSPPCAAGKRPPRSLPCPPLHRWPLPVLQLLAEPARASGLWKELPVVCRPGWALGALGITYNITVAAPARLSCRGKEWFLFLFPCLFCSPFPSSPSYKNAHWIWGCWCGFGGAQEAMAPRKQLCAHTERAGAARAEPGAPERWSLGAASDPEARYRD